MIDNSNSSIQATPVSYLWRDVDQVLRARIP